jgi:hypothetical protein
MVENSNLTWLVVLLDEADVFLEERSLADMQRNALVSGMSINASLDVLLTPCFVFLRVLEYYNGKLCCKQPHLYNISRINLGLVGNDIRQAPPPILSDNPQIWTRSRILWLLTND